MSVRELHRGYTEHSKYINGLGGLMDDRDKDIDTMEGVSISRVGWDEYFTRIAMTVALRGDCTRSQVGAVLVDGDTHRILSTGYNGVNPGELGCLSGSCPRGNRTYSERPPGGDYSDCIAEHAEPNTLYWWRDYGQEGVSNVQLYISREPCEGCLSLSKLFGVNRIVYKYKQILDYQGLLTSDNLLLKEILL